MRRLVTLLLLLLAAPASATELAISPFPAEGENATLQDHAAAWAKVDRIGATAVLVAATWSELEPAPHRYDMAGLRFYAALAEKHDLRVYLAIQPIDTNHRELPSDLAARPWDDPRMIERFARLLREVKSALGRPDWLSIGNEADVYLAARPTELAPYLRFFADAKRRARSLFPGTVVGVTVTEGGLMRETPRVARRLVAASDALFATYYPLDGWRPRPPSTARADLAALAGAAGGKRVILQELGYPSAASLGSSEARQARFLTLALDVAHRRDFAFVNVFALHDFTPGLCDWLVGYYGIPPEGLRDFLCSLGLRDTSGRAKPALRAVRDAFAAQRRQGVQHR